MTTDQFVKKISHLLKDDEVISSLCFKSGKDVYYPISQWFSGGNGEFINLWCRKVNDVNPDRIYPFLSEDLDKVKFKRR